MDKIDNRKAASVLILGDNEIAREGLKRLLIEAGFQAECRGLEEMSDTFALGKDEPEHLILVDAQVVADAITVCRMIRPRLARARVVLIGNSSDVAAAKEAFSVGVDGYLARQLSYLPMMLMLELVALGEKVLPKEVVDDFAANGIVPAPPNWDDEAPGHDLSDRELSILQCLVNGDQNKVIGGKLGITEATVKVHVKGILRKLHLLNRTQAAIWVFHSGLSRQQDRHETPALKPLTSLAGVTPADQ